MSTYTLFAFMDGFDLHDLADEVAEACEGFVAERNWPRGVPRVVNHRVEAGEEHTSNDLPEWELGISMDLPDPGGEPPGWFSDIEAIALFLGSLHARTGREFVIGIADDRHGYAENLFTVRDEHPDLELLREIVGGEAIG